MPRLGRFVLPPLASMAAATTFALATWYLLPYEVLERTTPDEQFVLWEGVMWMMGLGLGLFGMAAAFGSSDMSARPGDPSVSRSAEHIRLQAQEGARGRMLFSDLPSIPWLMMGAGSAVLLLAIAARAFFGI